MVAAGDEGHVDCVQLLLDAGANKDAKDWVRGRSAAYAVGRECVFVMSLEQ